ncbi:hypothetical protein MD484_g6382, partial [Candolleomyces efflorescens]
MSSRSTPSLPASSPPPPSSDTADAADARYKRLYEGKLREDEERAGKRSRKNPTTQNLGRGINRVVDLFQDVEDIVRLADEHASRVDEGIVSSDEESADEDEEETEEERAARMERLQERRVRKRAPESIKILSRIIPKFQDKLDNAESEELSKWFKELQIGAGRARSDDTHRLMSCVADWVNSSLTPAQLIRLSDRDNRGLQHDVCGMLLSPVDLDWDDATTRTNIRNFAEGYELSATARALYANYKGDPTNLEKDFLKSGLLVKTYKCIFTSPSSANSFELSQDDNASPAPQQNSNQKKRSSRKHVAALLHMDHAVSSRSIAYAAIQLLFALSSAHNWSISHQGLNFAQTYSYIVHFFEGAREGDLETKKTADDLLKWWNNQIFPDRRATAVTSGASRSFDALAKQRAARRRKNQS